MAKEPVKKVNLDPGVKHVTRQPVKSSNVKSIGYDPFCALLEVEFLSGGVYQYFPVATAEYAHLMTADSIGSHLSREIVPNKACRQVLHHDPYDEHHAALATGEGMPEPVPND